MDTNFCSLTCWKKKFMFLDMKSFGLPITYTCSSQKKLTTK